MNGDGFVDVVTGVGDGGRSNARVFSGQSNVLLYSFFVTPDVDNGVRVAAEDLDADGKDDLVFTKGEVEDGGEVTDNRARVTYASNLASGRSLPTAFSQPLFDTGTVLNVG